MTPRSVPFFFLSLFGLYLLNFRLAAAKLYPTCPVEGTVYSTQHCKPVTWKDDHREPSMTSMGQLTVDLYCKDLYVFTIAQVDPRAQTLMFCPPRNFHWPDTASCNKFKLLFNGTNAIIETHDFRITGIPTPATNVNLKNNTETSPAPARTTSGPGGRTITISPSSTPGPSSFANSNSNQRSQGYNTSSTTVYADPLPHGSSSQGSANRNGASLSRGVDIEKMKFRFVFIVWPALIGISMAL